MSVFISMLILCNKPLQVKAVYNNRPTTKQEFNYDSFIRNTDKYIYMNFDNNDNNDSCACLIRIPVNVLSNSDYVTLDNNILIIDCPSNMFAMCISTQYVNKSEYNLSYLKVDFNTNIVEFKFYNNGQLTTPSAVYNSPYYGMNTYNFYNFDSDCDFNITDEYNVIVNFNPTLSGNVDREVTVNGSKSMLSSLVMTVENNCSFDIQYDMRIFKKFQQTHRSYDALTADDTFFDDDPIFMYYKNQWVYCTNYDDMNSFLNDDTVKENKPSYWHFLSSGATDTVTIDFSQLNFLEGEEYTVTVRAIRNNYGLSSEQIVYFASSDPAISDLYQLQGDDIQTVYTSDFVMINYNDVKYDPNNNNNGVLAYNGRNGQAARNNYQYSRNAREESNGTIDYSSRNLYTNQNSWLNQQRNTVIQNHSSYKSGSIPASLSNHFNSFLTFITSIFSKLPLDIQHIYIYGFVSIVVLGIILKVIK